MKYVMLSHGTTFDRSAEGKYLKFYDPEFNDGVGHVVWTDNLDEAIKFANAFAGFSLWRVTSKVHPVRRTDGKPNRPLTAHTIEMVPYPERSDDGSTGTD